MRHKCYNCVTKLALQTSPGKIYCLTVSDYLRESVKSADEKRKLSCRNLQHPFNRQARALDDFVWQFDSRQKFLHAVAHFFERIHLHKFALAATAVVRR